MPDYQYINSTGVIFPDTADILTEVETEFKSSFGQDLIVTPDTPQGVMIADETISRDAAVRNNCDVANQINPNIAGGIFLDAICALTGLERLPATYSTVLANLTGIANTIINAGSQAQTEAGEVFQSISSVTLDSSGNGSVLFQSILSGPVGVSPGDLSQIITNVLGWETVTNPSSATLGTLIQSDVSLRAMRKVTLGIQGTSLPVAITSGLYNTTGVQSLVFQENVGVTTATINGISMVAHSIYVCVNGGTDVDVATSLLENKSAGADWNGSVTVPVTEPASGQIYNVKFDRPTAIPIFVQVTVKADTALIDPVNEVKSAIIAYASGQLEGEKGFVVGGDVSAFELAGAINRANPAIYVQDLKISLTSGSFSSSEIPIAINQIATISATNISVTVV